MVSAEPMVLDVRSMGVLPVLDLRVSVIAMVVVPAVNSKDALPALNFVVSVLFMVLDVKWMGVPLVLVLVVYVEPISPYAEIVAHSIGGIPFPVYQRT